MQLSHRIEHRITLHSLRVLAAVAQCGTMRKAAARLNTTQPSVSRAIAGLENAVGLPLFDRSTEGVELTSYGRALLDGGAAMFDDLRQAARNIEALADPSTGEVRIGSVPVLSASYVTAIVDRLTQRHPRMQVHLVIGLVEKLRQELNDRNIDLAIAARLSPFVDARFDFEFLFDGSFVVAAGAQSKWARKRKVALADLVKEPWTLPSPESALGSGFAEAFCASGLAYPRATVIADPVDVRISLLATGRFLTIFNPSVLELPVRRGDIVALPVALPVIAAPIGILTLKGRSLSPVAKRFIEHARKAAKLLAKE
jgi:DNA-binding transcriptional LysR family regulator